jgi:hypothetical protein
LSTVIGDVLGGVRGRSTCPVSALIRHLLISTMKTRLPNTAEKARQEQLKKANKNKPVF